MSVAKPRNRPSRIPQVASFLVAQLATDAEELDHDVEGWLCELDC
jgi:hypothetical protein